MMMMMMMKVTPVCSVQYFEDGVDVVPDRVLVDSRLGEVSDDVVDGTDDQVQLVGSDYSVAVDVIQVERPFQLLQQSAAQ